jgi:hypothetical protein
VLRYIPQSGPDKHDSTPGANLSFRADIKEPRDFYVELLPYGRAGKVLLRID